jgi:hypothetical protein
MHAATYQYVSVPIDEQLQTLKKRAWKSGDLPGDSLAEPWSNLNVAVA